MTRVMPIAVCSVIALVAGVAALATRPPTIEPPVTDSIENSITSFARDHPEWAVLRNDPRDATPIRFGHAKHLDRNLSGAPPGGLQCVSCHAPEPTGRAMLPISFDAHCRECHAADLGNIDVAEGIIAAEMTPHGSVAEIALALDRKLGEWVQQHPEKFAIAPVTAEPGPAEPPAEAAPSKGRRRISDRDKPKAEVPAFSSTEAREAWFGVQRTSALESLASNSRCGYCHTNAIRPGPDGLHFEIPPPNIPDRWLPRAHFSHLSHEMLRCNECHIANESHDTSHILLPTMASCRECHAPALNGSGGAPHDCVLCHTYHMEAPPSQGLRVVDDLRRKR